MDDSLISCDVAPGSVLPRRPAAATYITIRAVQPGGGLVAEESGRKPDGGRAAGREGTDERKNKAGQITANNMADESLWFSFAEGG